MTLKWAWQPWPGKVKVFSCLWTWPSGLGQERSWQHFLFSWVFLFSLSFCVCVCLSGNPPIPGPSLPSLPICPVTVVIFTSWLVLFWVGRFCQPVLIWFFLSASGSFCYVKLHQLSHWDLACMLRSLLSTPLEHRLPACSLNLFTAATSSKQPVHLIQPHHILIQPLNHCIWTNIPIQHSLSIVSIKKVFFWSLSLESGFSWIQSQLSSNFILYLLASQGVKRYLCNYFRLFTVKGFIYFPHQI